MCKATGSNLNLALQPGATCQFEPPDKVTFNFRQHSAPFINLSPAVYRVLDMLVAGTNTREHLRQLASQSGKVSDVLWLEREIGAMLNRGWLAETLVEDGKPVASRTRLSASFRPQKFDPAVTYIPSRFACLRTVDGSFLVESPLIHATVNFHDWRGSMLYASLLDSRSPGIAGLHTDTAQALQRLLVETGLLIAVDSEGQTAEARDPALRLWEFHDLLFHARSRQGRAIGESGATYRLRDEIEHPPVAKPPMSDQFIPLAVPFMDEIRRSDPTLAWAVENRHSLRRTEGGSLSVEQLGEFLYRTARIKEEFDHGEYAASSRPYPGGGAVYELELYVATERCDRLVDGLYHYRPDQHVLELLPSAPELRQQLVDQSEGAMAGAGRPRALIIIACRFQRLSWKYEGIAYALALKDVGVLMQTFYLVATVMGLYPCALGSGNTDAFCLAAGLNYYEESSVGEFALC